MSSFQRDPASYTDPNGYVFWRDGEVFRRIDPKRAAFMRGLLTEPAFQGLMSEGKLSRTALVSDDAEGLTLAHGTLWPRSYPQEWPTPMLKDAAQLILEVAATAAAAGYGLADGHPWNVLFDGPKPVFIDWGSLTEAPGSLLWPAEAQFNRFVLYPLHLYAAGAHALARGRLADLALGVGPELALNSLPAGYKLRHPWVSTKLTLHQAAAHLTGRGQAAPGPVKAPAKTPDPQLLNKLRPGFFRGIQREVAGLTITGASDAARWEAYYAQCPSMAQDEEAAKQRLLEDLLSRFKPTSVLDLGANTGRYAMMAAKGGARVVAVDQDDASMAALYHEARTQSRDILPLVMDLGNPTPANGWCAEQRPDALTRLESECVLMLALIHHLVFSGNVNFEQIARLATRSGRKVALIEWVDGDDPMAQHLRRTATKDFGFYTLENMVAALSAAGFAVEALAPHAATRRLLVCTRA